MEFNIDPPNERGSHIYMSLDKIKTRDYQRDYQSKKKQQSKMKG